MPMSVIHRYYSMELLPPPPPPVTRMTMISSQQQQFSINSTTHHRRQQSFDSMSSFTCQVVSENEKIICQNFLKKKQENKSKRRTAISRHSRMYCISKRNINII